MGIYRCVTVYRCLWGGGGGFTAIYECLRVSMAFYGGLWVIHGCLCSIPVAPIGYHRNVQIRIYP